MIALGARARSAERGERLWKTRAAVFALLFVATNASLALLFPFDLSRFALCAALYTTGTLLMLYLLFHPRNQFLVHNRWRVNSAGKRALALTFDDGPNPEHTPELLRILAGKGVKATFFVVGRQAEEHPELVRRLAAEGHQVANHTYSHPSLFCFLPPARLREEIDRGQQAVFNACGSSPRYFRSPVGLRHPLVQVFLLRAGLEFISWRVRAFDTRLQTQESIARRITAKVVPGDIILLHDRPGEPTARMLSALPGIIDSLKDQGFEFVAV
jgi:peptidoglycan/xylan/chitin deacetylase (PgdA/CDA1 family)